MSPTRQIHLDEALLPHNLNIFRQRYIFKNLLSQVMARKKIPCSRGSNQVQTETELNSRFSSRFSRRRTSRSWNFRCLVSGIWNSAHATHQHLIRTSRSSPKNVVMVGIVWPNLGWMTKVIINYLLQDVMINTDHLSPITPSLTACLAFFHLFMLSW